MPQEFHVVRCFGCETFQVQIVKKVNKFQCKMCGEKQSVKKVYAKGSGKDCRLHVQKLNQMRVESQQQTIEKLHEIENNSEETVEINSCEIPDNKPKTSKWVEFLPEPEKTDDDTDTELADSRYTFERPNKRKSRGRKSEDDSGKSTKKSKYNFNENLLENKQNCFTNDLKLNKPMDFKNTQQKMQKVTKWNDFESFNDDKPNYSDSDNENTEEMIENEHKTNFDQWNNFKIDNNDRKEKKENNTKVMNIVTKEQKPIQKSKWDSYITEESDDEIESNLTPIDQVVTKINKDVDELNSYGKSTNINRVEFNKENESISQISKGQLFRIHESDDDLDNLLDF